MGSSNQSGTGRIRFARWTGLARRALLAGATILVLSSTAGCVVGAFYAVPIALNDMATSIARALPVDEEKYIVHSHRPITNEADLAAAAPAAALAEGSKAVSSPVARKSPPSASPAGADPVPMPVLAGSLARRTRL